MPPFDAFDTLKIIKNGFEIRILQPPQVEGVKNSKKQTTKHYKAGSQTLKKFLSFCSFLIQVQR